MNCIHTWSKCWSAKLRLRFSGSTSSVYALRMKQSLLSLHVQTQSAYHISALSCLFPPLCKTGISKDTGAKTECRRGRCSDLSAQHALLTKVGVTLATFRTAIMHGALTLVKNAVLYTAHTNMHTQKYLQCYSLYVEGIFSVWPTDSPDNNEQVC